MPNYFWSTSLHIHGLLLSPIPDWQPPRRQPAICSRLGISDHSLLFGTNSGFVGDLGPRVRVWHDTSGWPPGAPFGKGSCLPRFFSRRVDVPFPRALLCVSRDRPRGILSSLLGLCGASLCRLVRFHSLGIKPVPKRRVRQTRMPSRLVIEPCTSRISVSRQWTWVAPKIAPRHADL